MSLRSLKTALLITKINIMEDRTSFLVQKTQIKKCNTALQDLQLQYLSENNSYPAICIDELPLHKNNYFIFYNNNIKVASNGLIKRRQELESFSRILDYKIAVQEAILTKIDKIQTDRPR